VRSMLRAARAKNLRLLYARPVNETPRFEGPLMIDRKAGCRLIAIALMLATLSGCRQLSMLREGHLPWSKTARLGQAPAASPAEAPKPLRPEQKADIQIAMARSLERQGRTDDAKKMYLQAIQAAPKRADAHHLLALLYDRNGECRAAEKYYQQALDLDAQNAELHCDLGYNYYLQQRWQDAESRLRCALELAPDLRRAHNNLALLLARTGREREALEEFMRAGASPAEAHANLANVLTLSDRWQEAEAAFQQALAINPKLESAQEGLRRLRSLAAKRSAGGISTAASPSAAEATQATYLNSRCLGQTDATAPAVQAERRSVD